MTPIRIEGTSQEAVASGYTLASQQDMKHAVKAGMATAILASPAFFESTRPMFVEYRGEWALISVCDPVHTWRFRLGDD